MKKAQVISLNLNTATVVIDPYQKLVEHYRVARQAWRDNPDVRKAAEALHMSEREYCNRYTALNFAPVTWTSTSTAPWKPIDAGARDRAFREAGRS